MILSPFRCALIFTILVLPSASVFSQAKGKRADNFLITECQAITEAGLYVLGNDLFAAGTCLTVEADFVSIDLGDHSITGQGSGSGITDLGVLRTGTIVKNGTVAGFEDGIAFEASQSTTVTNVRSLDNVSVGFLLGPMTTARNNQAIRNDQGIVVECPSSLFGNSTWDNGSDNLLYIYQNLCEEDLQHNSFGQSAAVICPTSLSNCGGVWVCLDNNHANCGSCGNSCGDGAACTNGTCEENPFCSIVGVCNDGNICTTDTCDPILQQCSSTPNPGAGCSDNNACTTNDVCGVNGQCTGQAVVCNDGLACTVDSCVDSGQCSSELLANFCLIVGVCYPEGALNPGDNTMSCQSGVNPYNWTPLP